ncbi:MAG: RNA pseudouridine synthase [Verrucomicrobia bacterium]|nr:RNA pseudouridine synthase [Verrucomicrobiota bacterium]
MELRRDANGLLALHKPAGVMSHPNTPADQPRALLTANYQLDGEFFEWPEDEAGGRGRLWLLNRLDSATSGVILAATSEALAMEVRAQFKRKQVRKIYGAVVFGIPKRPLELWRDLLSIEKRAGQIRTAAGRGQVLAESQMSLVRAGRREPRLALLRLEPRTGRSHQLRVQCARRGLPIVGDQTYGDFARNREFARQAGTKRLFLHSMETSFEYEFGGRRHAFSAKSPLPEEFESVL